MTSTHNIIPLSPGETGNQDCEVAIQAAFAMGKRLRANVTQALRWQVLNGFGKSVVEPVKLTDVTTAHVHKVVRECGGNKQLAADKLGCNRSTVYSRLRKVMPLLYIILLMATLRSDAAQVVPGVQMAQSASPFALPLAVIVPFKQTVLTWDNPVGASNRVAWGRVRNDWTNNVLVFTNSFFVTNGWSYKVTAVVNGIESTPALWPSNKIERVWVQTSTNLLAWTDSFIWRTNLTSRQEYLRLRQELIRWE